MAIIQIKVADYKKEMERRKKYGLGVGVSLYFRAANGKCYKTTEKGMKGAKEIRDFENEIKEDVKRCGEQLTLL